MKNIKKNLIIIGHIRGGLSVYLASVLTILGYQLLTYVKL